MTLKCLYKERYQVQCFSYTVKVLEPKSSVKETLKGNTTSPPQTINAKGGMPRSTGNVVSMFHNRPWKWMHQVTGNGVLLKVVQSKQNILYICLLVHRKINNINKMHPSQCDIQGRECIFTVILRPRFCLGTFLLCIYFCNCALTQTMVLVGGESMACRCSELLTIVNSPILQLVIIVLKWNNILY